MLLTKQRWLFFGLGMVAAATCVVLLSTLRQPQEPLASAPLPSARQHRAPIVAPPAPAARDTKRVPQPQPSRPVAQAGSREGKGTAAGGPEGSRPQPGAAAPAMDRPRKRVLTEEEFIDLVVKIRVWQNAIADTPEGRERLEELVRQLLDSQDLTPSDLEAFGRRVGPEALQRIDREIARRVAELGERRMTKVEPRSPAGSGTAERDTR